MDCLCYLGKFEMYRFQFFNIFLYQLVSNSFLNNQYGSSLRMN